MAKKILPRKNKPESILKLPRGYKSIVADIKQLIADSRQRAITTVNRELVLLYWQLGTVIVQQQEKSNWGDAVVERLAEDLRCEFPDMKGLMKDNLFRMRKFALSCREIDQWIVDESIQPTSSDENPAALAIVDTLCPHFYSTRIGHLVVGLSWSHHRSIVAGCESSAERYFYIETAIRERWSVRELRRQIDSELFLRYMSVKHDPKKCLPDDGNSGEPLPFKDLYVLEFLGLAEEHSEQQLRHSILANLRDFFLEFGRDLTFVGEEYPLTVGGDTFSIDLLFFHRLLQCLVVVELKTGKFKPEYVGKSQFYCAALDERVKLPHERPSIGLVLCKSANQVQVRLALTTAADKIGVATYQTALPNADAIQKRLSQLPEPRE